MDVLNPVLNVLPTSIEPYDQQYIWIVVVGFIFAFILAIAVGANDVANSFGTSVGSGALTLKQACILATIFEIAGAVLLGSHVTETIRTGIVDIEIYQGAEEELMLGYLATLLGCAIWLFVATYLRLPVSCTHTTVAATVGYSLAARGFEGIKWWGLGKIVLSWFISPVASGLVSVILVYIIEYTIMRRCCPLRNGLVFLPIIYAITMFVNVFGVTNKGPEFFYLDNTPLWVSLVISLIFGFGTGLIVQCFAVPYLRNKILSQKHSTVNPSPNPSVIKQADSVISLEKGFETPYHSQVQLTPLQVEDGDKEDTEKLFTSLQVLTAIFGSFAHGGNDTANAVGPMVALWVIFSKGSVFEDSDKYASVWILLFGGVGISVGLWLLGRRVIETVGTNLTKIRPSTGFTIEIGSACTVLLASKLGLPISTTHCKVGSVVFVGYADGKNRKADMVEGEKSVNWKLFGGIAASWIATIPAAVGVTALIMWLLSLMFL